MTSSKHRSAAQVEPEVGESSRAEERDPGSGQDDLPAIELLRGDRLVERPGFGEGDGTPEHEQAEQSGRDRVRPPHHGYRARPAQLQRRGCGQPAGDHQAHGGRRLEAPVSRAELPGSGGGSYAAACRYLTTYDVM